jgi:hypothetical protein
VSTAGRLASDGTRVYRTTGPLVLWWSWVVLAVLALSDLVIQGRDLLSLRFALGILTVTGLIFACALWPRVTADDARITVRNPFRDYDIPWGAVRGIYLGDAVEVQCARMAPKKDKTVHCWALTSPRRARARAQMRTQRGRRTPRGALTSDYGRLPESARALAETTVAEVIARELAQLLDERRRPGGTGVLAARWAWQPLAVVVGPAVALAITQLAAH